MVMVKSEACRNYRSAVNTENRKYILRKSEELLI